MSRYGTSLDIGADMKREKDAQEALRQQAEEDAKPTVQRVMPRASLQRSQGQAQTVKEDQSTTSVQWGFIVGAVAFIVLIIALISWSTSSLAPVAVPVSAELANADANTVNEVIGSMKGLTAPAAVNASNHTNVSS